MVNGTPAPAASTSSLASLVEFLRSPQCLAVFNDTFFCCGQGSCSFGLIAVDVYYWPAANANTSCLSVVGTDKLPLDEGATTGEVTYNVDPNIYWASTEVCRIDEAPWTTTTAFTNAYLESFGGLTFKLHLTNPWDRNEKCTPLTSTGLGANALTTNRTLMQISMTASLAEDVDESSSSLMAFDGLRLYVGRSSLNSIADPAGFSASPSVYINFKGLQAFDLCGNYGPYMSETMIAFDPGELSTIHGGPFDFVNNYTKYLRPFDFADLPCPPQDVMVSVSLET